MTTKIERRGLIQDLAGVKPETRADGKEILVGYAAVFWDANNPDGTRFQLWDDYYEIILPGAFDNVLQRCDCRCLTNHMPSWLLGRNKSGTMTLSVDAKGLRYECDVADNTAGRDTMVSVRRGDISGSSFGFTVKESNTRDIGNISIREIVEIEELYDVGPVTYPAYLGTDTEVAKRSFDEFIKTRINPTSAEAERRARRLRMMQLG